jgi:hypothetical protein
MRHTFDLKKYLAEKEARTGNTGLAQLLWNLKLNVSASNKLKYSGTWEVLLTQ